MNLTDNQRAQLSISPTDPGGKPAPLDGPPTWTSSDRTIATVVPGRLTAAGAIEPDASGLFAVLEGIAPSPTPARITVTGDAAIGADVRPVSGALEVIVGYGRAVSIPISVDWIFDASAPPPPPPPPIL